MPEVINIPSSDNIESSFTSFVDAGDEIYNQMGLPPDELREHDRMGFPTRESILLYVTKRSTYHLFSPAGHQTKERMVRPWTLLPQATQWAENDPCF